MCRITAAISTKAVSIRDLLCEGPKCLFAQADAVPGMFQDDGWGVARFTNGAPRIIKSPGPARLEKKAFEKAAAGTSRVTIAHLRDASTPGQVKAELVRPANTQPFSGNGIAFGHNGTLYIHKEIRARLGKYAARVKGSNDSEVLFWQVMKMLDACGSPEVAIEMALDEIRAVWNLCKSKYPDRKTPGLGLNMFLASPNSLTVFCHHPVKKTALLTPGWEWGRIAWRRDNDRVVFSSEPADARPGWKKMNDKEIASAVIRNGRVDLSFKKVHF
jgi:predicted glutamine amidotransferase